MAVTYGFFNSVNRDRKYNAEQMSEYFRGIINEGVYQHLDGGLAVTAGTGLAVNVAAGRAIIQNRWVQNSAAMSLTIAAASETYARKDAVVIRLNWSSRSISIAVKTGTPAASPVAPSMTRNSTTYEMALAYVNVAANATSVTVTDKRSDSTVCGWVTVAQSTSGEVDAMLNDMKTGFDGEVYDSPGAAVRACDTLLDKKMLYSSEVIDKILKVNVLFFKNNVFINKNTGAEVSYSGFKCTDYIPIFSKTIYMQKPFYDAAGLAFYDSTKTYISGVAGGSGTSSITTDIYMVEVPANAAYFRTTVWNSESADIYADISQVDDMLASVYESMNYELDFAYSGFINKNNGTVSSSTAFKCTDYVPIYGKVIKMQMPFYDAAGIAFYDNSKTFISGTGRYTFSESQDNNYYMVIVPDGAEYFRTSKRTTFTNTGFYAICGTKLNRNTLESASFATESVKEVLTYSRIDYVGNGFINRNNGNVIVTDGFSYSNFIKINSSYIGLQKPFYDQAGAAFYDENKTYISGIAGGANLDSVTKDMYLLKVPANAVYFRTCKNNQKNYNIIFGNFDVNVKSICLPDTIRILPNVPMRVYYYQICSNREVDLAWKVTYTGDVTVAPTDEYVAFSATSAKTGTVTISATDAENNKICEKTFSVVCSEKSIEQKAIFIGDSFTDYAFYLAQLKSILGDNLTLYGTRSTTAEASDGNSYTVNHEGRGGWSAATYNTRSEDNPFYNNGFDFSYYMTNHSSYSDVTDVYIMLGMNGGTAGNMKTLTDSIKTYNSSIKIHIILQPKVANCSRTYGANWHANLTVTNENFQKYWQSVYDLLSEYDIIPGFINVNPWYDYPRILNAVSSRNPETVQIVTDVIHPNKYGHYSMADTILAVMKKNVS